VTANHLQNSFGSAASPGFRPATLLRHHRCNCTWLPECRRCYIPKSCF